MAACQATLSSLPSANDSSGVLAQSALHCNDTRSDRACGHVAYPSTQLRSLQSARGILSSKSSTTTLCRKSVEARATRLGGDGDVDSHEDAIAEDFYAVLGLVSAAPHLPKSPQRSSPVNNFLHMLSSPIRFSIIINFTA